MLKKRFCPIFIPLHPSYSYNEKGVNFIMTYKEAIEDQKRMNKWRAKYYYTKSESVAEEYTPAVSNEIKFPDFVKPRA